MHEREDGKVSAAGGTTLSWPLAPGCWAVLNLTLVERAEIQSMDSGLRPSNLGGGTGGSSRHSTIVLVEDGVAVDMCGAAEAWSEVPEHAGRRNLPCYLLNANWLGGLPALALRVLWNELSLINMGWRQPGLGLYMGKVTCTVRQGRGALSQKDVSNLSCQGSQQ